MHHPKFIQIISSASHSAFKLFALDENGEVWYFHDMLREWLVCDRN